MTRIENCLNSRTGAIYTYESLKFQDIYQVHFEDYEDVIFYESILRYNSTRFLRILVLNIRRPTDSIWRWNHFRAKQHFRSIIEINSGEIKAIALIPHSKRDRLSPSTQPLLSHSPWLHNHSVDRTYLTQNRILINPNSLYT